MTKKIIFFVLNSILLTLVFVVLTFFKVDIIPNALKAILIICVNVLYFLNIVFKWFNMSKTSKICLVSYIFLSFAIIIYALLYRYHILDTISSVEGLKNYILSTKEKGTIMYILIQTAQVIFLPVPAAIICVAGSLIYGPLLGGLYCSIGILLGSFISFFIGKTFGYRVVSWIAGKDNTDKYSEIIRKRGAFFLGLAFLLPMFPDDILCLIAGITNMKFKTFAIVTTITRPIGVICMSFFGSGYLIPFRGWGIYVWIVILILAVAMVYITYRYQDKLQNLILQKVFKKRKPKSKENQS